MNPKECILGFSGLPLAKDAKRLLIPDMSPSEIHMTQGADAAAAITVNGAVIGAAAEERFDGVKHSSAFPTGAASYCLQAAAITADELSVVAHSFSYGAYADALASDPFYADLYARALAPDINRRCAEDALRVDLAGRFLPVEHHLAHAATAFYPSGFRDALVLVSDGIGERNSASVWHWTFDQGPTKLRDIAAINSLGLLYGIFTTYLGFQFADGEYKVMGLAPLGDSRSTAPRILSEFVELLPHGEYRVPLLLNDVSAVQKETHRGSLAVLEDTFGPRRQPHEPIATRHKNVAAGIQAALQTVQLHVLGHFRQERQASALAMAGGVALNCAFNGTLRRTGLFDHIYIQPASGDDGSALGAALVASDRVVDTPRQLTTALLGPCYTEDEYRTAATTTTDGAIVIESIDESDMIDRVVAMIADGAIVGWFQGRMEFGPRALGSRSILADPRRADMRDRINSLVKKREGFRPFAPAVVAEHASRFFEISPGTEGEFRNMLMVAHIRPEYRTKLPAVTHVDDSARVQTVFDDENPRFARLLRAMDRACGYPILLNTSFNVAGQPIVRTPYDAVQTFQNAKLDALVMGRTILLPQTVTALT